MKRWFFLLLLAGHFLGLSAANQPTGLVCNLLVRPELTVITTPEPQFGWTLPAVKENAVQSAYRILVASSVAALNEDTGDLWDSGKQVSAQSQHIRYTGKALQPGSTYYWKVACWDGEGRASSFSEPQQFHTGEFGRVPAWPGESRWVKMDRDGSDFWTFEDRNPIDYHANYPVKMVQRTDDVWFMDFGRSSFAYAVFCLYWPEPAAGGETEKTITVRIGEKATGDSIDRNPGGGVLYREYPLTIRPGKHTYTLEIPRFVSHYPHSQVMPAHMQEVIPFRYCEIDCGSTPVDPDASFGTELPLRLSVADQGRSIRLLSATQHALHTVFDESASAFSSSSELLNAIYDLCKYSIMVNTFNGDYAASQRERMMYEADSYIHQMGHYAVDREFSVARYSLQNMIFHATWPTEWISHTVMMAWVDYLHTGNKDVIATLYDQLTPKTLVGLTTDNGLISTRTGLQTKAFLSSIHFNGKELKDIVDWPHGTMSGVLKGGETDDFDFQDYNTVVNAFHYHSLVLMADMAAAVGKKQDAAYYDKQSAKVRKAFNRFFFDKAKGIYTDGIGTDHASLHSNLYALAFGLVPGADKETVIAYIKEKGMACGVYGANYLLEALFDAGEADYAIELMTSTTDRSWRHMLQIGTTITIEAWDNKYKTNNGWSHAWSSSPAHILPRKLIGIEPETPGFETFRVKPAVSSIREASVKLPTIRGTIKAGFTNRADGFSLTVSVPGNTKAQVYLPVQGAAKPEVFMDGVLQKKYEREGKYVLIKNVGSGEHRFELK